MKCEECSDLLDLYLEKELSEDRMREFSEHISSCRQCQEELAFAKKLREALDEMPKPSVPEHFLENIREQIAEEQKREKKEKLISIFLFRRAAPVLAAALLVGVFLNVDMMKLSKDSLMPETSGEIVVKHVETLKQTEEAEETMIPEVWPTPEVSEVPAVTQAPDEIVPTAVPTQTPKTEKTPQPTQALKATEKKSEHTTQAAADADITFEETHEPSVQAEVTEEIPEQKSVVTGGGGGARRSSGAAEHSAGQIVVSSDRLSDAKSIAGKYGDYQNRVYEMSQSEMNRFLDDLEQSGIAYENHTGGEELVSFKIVAE